MAVLNRFLAIFALVGLALPVYGSDFYPACKAVEATISNASGIYYPGNALYDKGKYHYFASSSQDPTCAVEPGTPEDAGKILNVIDATRTPFAVKSGGHTINPNFSSTTGIQIYTGRFSQVTYDATSGTVVVGTGLVWDVVYEVLQQYDVTVVGGRVTGVGVGGLLLGGGYSYKSNQYGLGIDSIVAFNLVLPNGTVTYVTESRYPDLFFGLKGGFNNFGIVTDFTMKVFPQTEVWGGTVAYSPDQFTQARSAISNFSVYSKDPKAAILPSYAYFGGSTTVAGTLFYDGPAPPSGTFDNFTNVPALFSDLKARSYLDLFLSTPTNSSAGFRGSWQMLGVSHYSDTLLKAIEDELTYWTAQLTPKSGNIISYTTETFLPDYLSHANSRSAFPTPAARKIGHAPSPLLVYFSWTNSTYDGVFVAAVEESANRLTSVAKSEGLLTKPLALYGNNVDSNTPLADIYGENLPSLRALKAKIDPRNTMGLAGGFKF